MSDGPHNGEFSIVHHKILDDTKFERVYEDDTLLATWLRLLMAADKTYPSPAPLPAGTDEQALAELVKVELIDELPHHHYIVHGMAAERARRSDRYKRAAQASWDKRRSSDAGAS